ncbi:hypothetical protein F66182_8486 [Fusarium sp. NRRL 66182]|nr:hypothetical protein F66182_8486 [Fusarium sp. NRRL 66182]
MRVRFAGNANYNKAHQRRTRDQQLQELQERLAKTEAQLALNTPKPTSSVQSQPEAVEQAISWPRLEISGPIGNSAADTMRELAESGDTRVAADMPTYGPSLLDIDLFTSFAEGEGSNIGVDWTHQPLEALEPLDDILLNRLSPQQIPHSASEEEMSLAELSTLHEHYFSSVYFSFPFLNRDRFLAESKSSTSPAMSALFYAVGLAGCSHPPQGFDEQSSCYTLARNYAEKCERDGRFEAMGRKLERSWLTLGRAAMLCSLLNLHQMDQNNPDGGPPQNSGPNSLCLPYTDDQVLLEERRRCVLMVELALHCFDHGQERAKTGFWDSYCALVKATDELFHMLKRHLNAASIRQDPVAFSLYLNLRATEIFSHESAIAQSEEQGLPSLMTTESQRRATAAAFQISSAVRLNLPSPRKAESDMIMLQAIFIAWPLTMALKALHRELVHCGSRETVVGVVASSRLLLAALDHIEESSGHWHQSITHVEIKLQEWDEKNGFDSLAL